MRFYCFHLMPWAHLPDDFAEQHDSAWVTCPNTLYDPEFGHPLYNRYLASWSLPTNSDLKACASTNTIITPSSPILSLSSSRNAAICRMRSNPTPVSAPSPRSCIGIGYRAIWVIGPPSTFPLARRKTRKGSHAFWHHP